MQFARDHEYELLGVLRQCRSSSHSALGLFTWSTGERDVGADIGLAQSALAVILSLELVARTLEGNVMPFERTPYPWGRDSVVENAPHRPVSMVSIPRCGFTLARPMDLGERLMKDFDGDSPCIARYGPSRFVFELINEPTA